MNWICVHAGARFGSASALFTGLNLPDRVHTVPRSMFDDGKGRAYLEQVATPESWAKIARAGTTNTGNTGMYLAYGAAGALLHHLQVKQHVDRRIYCELW